MRVLALGNFDAHRRNIQTQIDSLARAFESEGIEVLRASYRADRLSKGLDVLRHLVVPPGGLRALDAVVAQVFNDYNIAIGLMAVLAGELTGVPAILMYHGGSSRVGSPREFLRRVAPVVVPLFRRAFEVQVASPFLGQVLAEFGVRASVMPHVLDGRWDRSRVRAMVTPRILWQRGFHDLYDPFMAVRAFERVVREVPEATMTMLGAGPLKEGVRRLVAERGIPGVTFLEPMGVDDLRRVVEAHDIFLHTNRYDNQPVSLIEAFSTGMVAVTTDAGGLPYVFGPGEGGFQVPVGDDAAAAERILALVRDHALGHRTSLAAIEVARRHRWESLRGPWLELLGRASAARRGRPGGRSRACAG